MQLRFQWLAGDRHSAPGGGEGRTTRLGACSAGALRAGARAVHETEAMPRRSAGRMSRVGKGMGQGGMSEAALPPRAQAAARRPGGPAAWRSRVCEASLAGHRAGRVSEAERSRQGRPAGAWPGPTPPQDQSQKCQQVRRATGEHRRQHWAGSSL